MRKDFLNRYFPLAMVLFLFLSLFISCARLYPDGENEKNMSAHVWGEKNDENITFGSKIIYMKHFTLSSSYSISYGTVTADMAGKDRAYIEKKLDGWDVVYVDNEKVIVEKEIDSYGPQTYEISTIKEKDDEYVCVYEYDDMGEKILHSVFDTPVMLFDEQTVSELREGIIVTGQDALFNALEDFGE